MDRKIKFRVWLKDRRKMGHSYNYNCLYDFFQDYGWKYHSPTPSEDNYVLMQYAGMQDKNDRDIYEGDIIEWGGNNFLVWFYKGSFLIWDDLNVNVLKTPHDSIMGYARNSEVIGNKFEGPELLDK